ncbi:hypothetical protein B0J11DRAFT_298962 [Dendryphion nanum]|uniref:Protein kinase domain-containing protein n=1 Tax=Dendryphion nanum TaxID=256645 RepID=A0A9P9IN20_9PLEO|nr:hypothetical protein B0J11DRAFT_298962 [Dendryphion nanum]
MSAEVSLAIVPLIDLALKYGNILREIYESFENAVNEIKERILRIDITWTKTKGQIKFLREIWQSLSEEHQNEQGRALHVLVNKLHSSIAQMNRVLKTKKGGNDDVAKGNITRWKYILIKDKMDKTIQDLEFWQTVFDPSWFLMLRIADSAIDHELMTENTLSRSTPLSTAKAVRQSIKPESTAKVSIFLPKDGLADAYYERIPFCSARLVFRPSHGGSINSTRAFVVDSIPCLPDISADNLTQDVRDLARKLAAADPSTFGLLQCYGVVKISNPQLRNLTAFDFIFKIPKEIKSPRSLRQVLITADKSTSLSDRVSMAQQLARSVSYVHTYGIVHKGIRPENVLVFRKENSTSFSTFLLGFERFRAISGHTFRAGDCVWQKELYRHPQRQGIRPEEAYRMQHDIYSLGVCLLEIGLWESFLAFSQEDQEPTASTIFHKLRVVDANGMQKPSVIKSALVHTAETDLPRYMGNIYTSVVVNCLTCLDETNADFGDPAEFEDEDGIAVGVRYIEKILHQLNSISI